MMIASHQTFYSQFKHLTVQTKFDQTDLLYIINGQVIEFLIEKSGVQIIFNPYHKDSVKCSIDINQPWGWPGL